VASFTDVVCALWGRHLADLSIKLSTPRLGSPYLHYCWLGRVWNGSRSGRNVREFVFFYKIRLGGLPCLLLPRMFAVRLTAFGFTLDATRTALLETLLSFSPNPSVEGLLALYIGTNLRVLEDFLLKSLTRLLSSAIMGAGSALFEGRTSFIRPTTEIFSANLTLFGQRQSLTLVLFLLRLSDERICPLTVSIAVQTTFENAFCLSRPTNERLFARWLLAESCRGGRDVLFGRIDTHNTLQYPMGSLRWGQPLTVHL